MTTKCESCRERLIDHHYRELALEDARSTAEHLADCAACALEYCRLSAALAGFRELDREAPRPEVGLALREKVAAEFRPSFFGSLARLCVMRVPIYQPALLLLVLFVLWTVVQSIAPVSNARTSTVLERFDATRVEIVDDHVL